MTKTYLPFDAGAGANTTEDGWRKMARLWLATGVIPNALNGLAVSQRAAGANMSVDVASGRAWLEGHFFESDGVENVPISAADPTNPRIDRVVVRADFTANTIDFQVLQGAPAVSPVAPTLTQTTTRWEISLAQVRVNANAATIVTANITDERDYGPQSAPGKPADGQIQKYVASTKVWTPGNPTDATHIPIVHHATGVTTTSTSYVHPAGNEHAALINVAKFPPGRTFYFEVIADNNQGASGWTTYVELFNATAGTQVTELSWVWSAGRAIRKRSAALTLTGDQGYIVRFRVDNSASSAYLYVARVIVE